MNILFCAMKHDYGDPNRGLSFEHTNFFTALVAMGHNVEYFDFMALTAASGKSETNRLLVERVRADEPDLLFCVLFTEEIEVDTLRTISESGSTRTFNWFCDDHWRFESFSRRYAAAFHWVSTTASAAPAKYAAIGVEHVIKTQWACNHFLYRPTHRGRSWDVTFIGQPHGSRRKTIEKLQRAGIDVYCRGFGWPAGRIDQEEMLEVFSSSRINLNLANSSRPRWRFWERRPEQIKGRNFEVPGCGGFLLTQAADDLDSYYVPGREIAQFSSDEELIHSIRHYLAHEEERIAIAAAGYQRTLREHTYEKRFLEIFAAMGLAGR